MKFLRVHSLAGEPLADIWPDEGDSVVSALPLSRESVPWDQRYRYARVQVVEQKMLTAKSVWLEPT